MTILEAALSDGSGILENGVGMTGVQSHGMDPTQAKALVQGMDEHSKDALKVKAVQEEQALHQQKARDASQLFKLGDRTIIGEWPSRRCGLWFQARDIVQTAILCRGLPYK